MNTKLIITIMLVATLGIVGLAVFQQQKRLPELEAKRPPAPVTPPPGLMGKDGKPSQQQSPLEFSSLFSNLKPAKQECFREKFGEERFNQIMANPAFTPSQEDNAIIGECLFAGATFQENPVGPSASADDLENE